MYFISNYESLTNMIEATFEKVKGTVDSVYGLKHKGGADVKLHSYLASEKDGVEGQLHAPAALP